MTNIFTHTETQTLSNNKGCHNFQSKINQTELPHTFIEIKSMIILTNNTRKTTQQQEFENVKGQLSGHKTSNLLIFANPEAIVNNSQC